MYQTRLFLKCNSQDSFLTITIYHLDGQFCIKFGAFVYKMVDIMFAYPFIDKKRAKFNANLTVQAVCI